MGPSAWTDFPPQDATGVRSSSLASHKSPPGQGATFGPSFRSLQQAPARQDPERADDSANDGQRSLVLSKRANECPIDLDPVEREGLDGRTTRNTRSRSRPARSGCRGSWRLHRLLRAQDILDQHAFGDLELEAGQRQPAFAQRLSDLRIEVLPAELRGRDVDGDPQESVPRRGLTASLHQHPVVNLGNRTASERRSRRLSAISLPPKRPCRLGQVEGISHDRTVGWDALFEAKRPGRKVPAGGRPWKQSHYGSVRHLGLLGESRSVHHPSKGERERAFRPEQGERAARRSTTRTQKARPSEVVPGGSAMNIASARPRSSAG